MAFTLLDSKLFIPKPRSAIVSRPRLIERLDRTLDAKLTLVSGPAGFGKTTLLTEWLAARSAGCAVAWLSLDESDNDPIVFWSYVIGAIQHAAPGAGPAARESLESPEPQAIQDILTTLLNELNAFDRDLVLVLDDYHAIDAVQIHESMTFLLDHISPRLHLVIASRADPPLPLARLRARGELVEVRAADLRFQPREAAAFFNDVMELGLSDPDLSVLEERAEGWIAALQLAALSMQGREDVSGFIDAFAGDNRYIVDYLVEEVLQKQSAPVRAFLLQTSVLDKLAGDVCRAVTGQEDSPALLRHLEDDNLFLVPLDDRRQWYRYHHLFADVLRARLTSEEPDRLPGLHRRASRWYEQNGDSPRAIRHTLAAADYDRAAGLIEVALPAMLKSRQDVTLRGWLDALPDAVLRLRPVLSAGYVSLLLHAGDFEPVEGRLRDAESALETASRVDLQAQSPSDRPAYVDEAQFRELPGMIALYRAGYSQVTGSAADTVRFARLALERLPEDAPLRGGAMALLGLALWSSGDLDAAYAAYAEGIARVHVGGYVNDSSTIMLADMRVAQGRLREAQGIYQRALRRAQEQGSAAPRGVADLHVGISEILVEQGDLDTATDHLAKSKALGENAGLPENRYRWFTAMAGVKQAQNDLEAALDMLGQAERLYAGGFSPDVRPIAAQRARIWIAQGRLAEAAAWSQERGLTPEDELTYLREYEHITLARLMIARHRAGAPGDGLAEAIQLLTRLLSAAEAGGRNGAVIELLVLLALAGEAQRERASALASLERALALAEPEGYLRVFAGEAPALAPIMREASMRANGGDAARLLARLEGRAIAAADLPAGLEALSQRELEIVRLLATDLSGPDIARELVVSLNTVRTHTKNVYTKLGVNSRRAAVRRAEELHLL